MPLNYHKGKVISLSEVGLDERWLQERILEDPSLLDLGDVSVVQRERKQAPDDEGDGELADRDYWEKRSNPESLRIVDQCAQLLSTDGHRPRLTYNRHHIAMGGSRQNFAWFHPRKAQKHCHFHVKVGEANLQESTAKLEGAGISVEPHRKNGLRVIVTPAEMKQHEQVVRDVLGQASMA